MRILENVELTAEFADILVKSKEAIDIPSEELQSSEQAEAEDEKDDDEVEAVAKKNGTDESSIEELRRNFTKNNNRSLVADN